MQFSLKPDFIFGNGGLDKWLSLVGTNKFIQATAGSRPQITELGALYSAGNSLYTPTSEDFNFAAGNFTMGLWYYPTGSPQTSARLLQSRSGDVFSGISFIHSSATVLNMYLSSSGSSWDIAGPMANVTLTLNAWNHLAFVRNGSGFVVYLNGVSAAIWSSAAALYYNAADTWVLGGQNTGTARSVSGYINDFFIVKGAAIWTNSFAPPARSQLGNPFMPLPTLAISTLSNLFDSGD